MKIFFYPLLFGLAIGATEMLAQDLEPLVDKESRKKFFADFTEADPFRINGSVGVNLRSYHATGIDDRQAPFVWYVAGQANVQVYRLNIPVSVLATAQSLTYSHPFRGDANQNRFTRIGASPYYKWVKLHFGHRYMDFSPLTVANHTFLGTGFELTPQRWRFAYFRGKLAKTEPQDLSLRTVNREIFKRRGWGAKVGYGTQESFVDLILFKAKDDPGLIDPLNADTAFVFQNENLVVGLNGQTMLFKKLRVNLELASSAFTKNAADPETDGRRLLHPSFLLQPRTSTTYRTAVNSGIQYQHRVFNLGLRYQRIDPDYRSLGAYFFNNDLENVTANAGVGLFKSRVRLDGSIGRQHNNLNGEKATQFSRTIGSLNAMYSAGGLNIDLNYSNYTANVDYVLNLDLDSLNAVIVTQQAGINAAYVVGAADKNRHTFSGNFAVQRVTDDVEDPSRSAESRMLNGLLGYALALDGGAWKFSTRASYNQNRLSQMLVDRYGAGLGVQKELIPKKWTLSVDANYYDAVGELLENQTLNVRAGTAVQPDKHHRFDLSVLLLNRFKSSGPNARDFRETTGILNYTYSF